MLVLIRNGEVYGPEPQGKKDVLLCAGKIALLGNEGEIDPRGAETLGLEIDVIDARECVVTPGFIEGGDGREVYFHRNAVLEGFDGLQVGSEVRFAEEQGVEGPQASTVSVVGKSD